MIPSVAVSSDVNMQLYAMLNKTRADNFPNFQELSVFEQSFESRRKQNVNSQFRSRSKNYKLFEGGSYTSSNQKGKHNLKQKLTSKAEIRITEQSIDSNSERRVETEITDIKPKAIMNGINSK